MGSMLAHLRRGSSVLLVLSLIVLGLPSSPLDVFLPLPRVSVASAAAAPVSTTRVSVSSTDGEGDGRSYFATISSDGRYVAFQSEADNLIPSDQNPYPYNTDIFLHDRLTGRITLVSVDSGGAQGWGIFQSPVISGNGQYVAFETGDQLVPEDNTQAGDVYVWDRLTNRPQLVTLTSTGEQLNNWGQYSSISADGRYVAFVSPASNVVPGDTNGVEDIFVRDRVAGTTIRASQASSGLGGNAWSKWPVMSPDGRYVAFESAATNLVSDDTNSAVDVFVHDLNSRTTTRASVNSSGQQANGPSHNPSFSADGQFVAFNSDGSNLAAGDTNSTITDVFLRDQTTGAVELVSLSSSGVAGNFGSLDPSVSSDARYVAFESYATNFSANDTNQVSDIFVRDRINGSTTRLSVSTLGVEANDDSWDPSIAADEPRYVSFYSRATNLVSNDTNGFGDIFVRDWALLPYVPGEQTYGGCGGGIHAANPSGCQSDPVNSATGSFLLSATDISLPGVGLPFEFRRNYTSADNAQGPLGVGWTHSYAASLTVKPDGNVTLRGEDGQRVEYIHQPDGSFVSAAGGRSKLTAVGSEYELLRSDQVRYRFNSQGRLTELRDRNGKGLIFAYDPDGRLSTATDSAGRVISFSHNASGLLAGISLPDGRSVGYGYTDGRLTTVTDLRGATTTYTYDAGGRLATVVDAKGDTTVRNTYGTDGRITEQFDALGNRSTFSWDPATETSTMTDGRGNTWIDEYSNNVLVRRVDSLGNVATFDYDRKLNLIATTDARGNTWKMAYDGRGNLLTRVAPAPFRYEESFKYDSQNNLTSFTDGRGNTTVYEYDSAGNLIKMTEPSGVVTLYGRDPAGTGLLTSLTDPRGKVTTFTYDSSGNLVKATSPLGNVTTMQYEPSGRMISRVEPPGNIGGGEPDPLYQWTYAYDAAGSRLSETDPLGNRAEWTYDAVGNLKTQTDAKSRVTTYTYNAASELISVKAPDNTVTSYDYDAAGNLVKRTDAKNRITSYDYDKANRITKVTSPINQIWTYAYDAAGNLTGVVTPAGNATPEPNDGTVSHSYDALNRRTGIDYSDATPDVQFGYDAAGNTTSMTDGAGTETYRYDALNRFIEVTRGSDMFSYEYDAGSNVRKRTYPGGTVMDYTFDDDGRLASVTTGGVTINYGYDVAGNLIQTTLPSGNGYVETRTYDRAGRLTEVKNAKGSNVLSRFTYTLDEVGNPNSVSTPTETLTYTYDPLDRLSEACFAASCPGANDPFIRYTYDDVGNRLTESRSSGVTTYTYNEADQLLSTSGPGGTVNYTYDANGNQTAIGGRTFSYDLANRPISTTSGRTTITYSYDGRGRRVQASAGAGSKTTKYIWDQAGSLPLLALERDGNGNLLRRYVHGNDLVSLVSGGASYYYHYDGLGSVANLTSSNGAAQWSYAYEPFGVTRSEVKHASKAPTNLMRFTGEQFDVDTGLYHMRARQYDPAQGRFLATDPLAPALSDPYVSAYVYVNNRPTFEVDPSGLRSESLWEGGFWSVWWDGFQVTPLWVKIAVGGTIVISGGYIVCYFACPAAIAAIPATVHGAQRLAEQGWTRAQIAATRAGQVFTQADGATVYVKEVSKGRFNILIEGSRGVITAHKNLPVGAIERFAEKFGWVPR